MGEFDLIRRYFLRPERQPLRSALVALGIGDDCALLQPRHNTQLAVSSDMLVEGRHFLSTVDPAALGHKALAVNLSDLAACGAKPLAFTLALALPEAKEAWLAAFSHGLFALADEHGCELVGGDTTRGPLNICITVFGEVPTVNGTTQALLRSGAQAGDDIYVSGTLGDARLALEVFRGNITMSEEAFAHARLRMERPTPRVALGIALRGIATSAIDLSDGLLGDLGHILQRSHVGATVEVENAMKLLANKIYNTRAKGQFYHFFAKNPEFESQNTHIGYILTAGDDYELAFTAPPAAHAGVLAASTQAKTPVTRIGRIDAQTGMRLVGADGVPVENRWASFDHFG